MNRSRRTSRSPSSSNTQFRDDWAVAPPSEQTTTGKGWTEDAACMPPSVKRWSGIAPRCRHRRASSSSRPAPRSTGPPSARRRSASITQRSTRIGSVPYAPVDDATVLHWVEGHSLTHDRPVLVPASLAYLLPLDTFCPQTSNGLAAGRTWHEAALRALCEVIERDALLFAWLTMRPAPLLDLMDAGDERRGHRALLCGAWRHPHCTRSDDHNGRARHHGAGARRRAGGCRLT